MTLNTLYNIGDEVWACLPNDHFSPRGFVVRRIKIEVLPERIITSYSDYSRGEMIEERYLFFTRQAAEEASGRGQ